MHDWTRTIECDSVDYAYNRFILDYTQLLDEKIPCKTVRFKKYQHKKEPWLTNGLLRSVKTKDRLYKTYLKTTNPASKYLAEVKYKQFRNLLNKLIRLAKCTHVHQTFENCKNNIKLTWKNIGNLLSKSVDKSEFPKSFQHNNSTISSPKEVSDAFNNFYVSIGPTLAQSMQSSHYDHKQFMSSTQNYPNFFMLPTCEQEVLSIVKNMKAKTSSGHDEINPKLLRETIPGILKPITHIINLSLKHGIVPDKMKLAKVIPIFKNGDNSNIANYRPISLLPAFSKILEKVVYVRLYKYFVKHGILNPFQYGFREFMSTDLAILELQDRIASLISSGSWCLGIFLDLSKAFDTINHEILISKLESYGVRGLALSWFMSYLSNRTQFTLINNNKSTVRSIECGVPQGSILGPLLFLIYINDINNAIKLGDPILFADDTNIIYSNKDLSELINNTNKELLNVSKWFTANKLSVNVKKTKFMLFRPNARCNSGYIQNILINNQALERVTSIKFLGVILEESLNWQAHINFKANKISKAIGVMSRLKHQLPEHTLYILYNSLILPHLHYAITAWGGSPLNHQKRLITLQKKALRILSKSSYHCHTDPIFSSCKLLKLHDLYKISCCKLMFQRIKGRLPAYHSAQLVLNNNQDLRMTRQSGDVKTPVIHKRIDRQLLSYRIGTVWNNLPTSLKQSRTSIHTFSKNLKKSFLSKYNNPCDIPNCFICLRNGQYQNTLN
jgi:hypothetical protein